MGNKKLLLICTLLLCIILIKSGTANALGESTVYVDPPLIEVTQLDIDFNATIKVLNAPIMTQYILSLAWDPNIIRLSTLPNGSPSDIVQGDFLGGEVFLVTLGGTPGRIQEVTEAKLAGTTSGDGTLFTIKFHSKDVIGTTQITIETAVFLIGVDLADLPTANNGTVNVTPEFPATLLLSFFLAATAIAFIAKTSLSRKKQDIKIP